MFLSQIMFLATLLPGCYCLVDARPIQLTALQSGQGTPAHSHECDSIDVRNDCSNLLLLTNCTVVKGFVIIVLLSKLNTNDSSEMCDYQQYSFPLLREITDYLIFFDVKGLKSIRELFPRLTVIRGRQLFLNYALGITSMPDLEVLEFKSLVAIQRGHVFISSCPKLCNLEKINWDRLTLSRGKNHIYPVTPEQCPTKSDCKSCDTEYCWSSITCQYFENDNVLNYFQGSKNCHKQCLGGCYLGNSMNTGCNVCRGLRDHGACVEQCPSDKYQLENYQRCLTEEECTQMGMYTHEQECITNCPNGYIPYDVQTQIYDCVPCQQHNPSEPFTIYNLADADRIGACKLLNGTLIISIKSPINEGDLLNSLSQLTEIRGYLKIFRSPHLTSLNFLNGLRIIAGEYLESDIYALILYDNANLKDLWDPGNLALERGSMYVHLNNKLCNHKLQNFRDDVEHDRMGDSLQTTDHDVLCGPERLRLQIEILSHRALKLLWNKSQTSEEIEVIYRRLKNDEVLQENSEEDANVCSRINWRRKLLLPRDLSNNSTHYSFVIEDLEPLTKYACLVKTFGSDDTKYEARSELKLVTTKANIPTTPAIVITKTTDSSLTFQIQLQNRTFEEISHYLLELYELPDDLAVVDQRNYCIHPLVNPISVLLGGGPDNEDYDDCCANLQEDIIDQRFLHNMREEFSCSLDRLQNCADETDTHKPLRSQRLEYKVTSFTLHQLAHFRLYALQLKACNKVGCSSYGVQSVRTNSSDAADKIIDLNGCRDPHTQEYRVNFNEPKHPNGVVTSYFIHYRGANATANGHTQNHAECVTRLQHAQARYNYIANLSINSDAVAVRIHTLAGGAVSPWVNLAACLPGPTHKRTGIFSDWSYKSVLVVCCSLGFVVALICVCAYRQVWCSMQGLRHHLPFRRYWNDTHPSVSQDRQILVQTFETVQYRNLTEDELKSLV